MYILIYLYVYVCTLESGRVYIHLCLFEKV